MSVPLLSTKYTSHPTLSAAQLHRRRMEGGWHAPPPAGIILCFQPSLAPQVERRYRPQRLAGFFGEVRLLPKTNLALATGFGVGAPAAAALLESFVAWGVTRFFAIGYAGGLQPHLHSGDFVLCQRALRDEGTSYHYLPPARDITPTSPITQLTSAHHAGTSWTTDAPYRETLLEIETYQREGLLTVEMEAAALFAVGQALNVAVGAAFVVADTFRAGAWQLNFDARHNQRRLEALFDEIQELLSRAVA